jgi:hypothetical protein
MHLWMVIGQGGVNVPFMTAESCHQRYDEKKSLVIEHIEEQAETPGYAHYSNQKAGSEGMEDDLGYGSLVRVVCLVSSISNI